MYEEPGSVEDWKIGFLIHAYGDSYSHTKGTGENLRAYGPILGHLLDGPEPDSIADNPDKYEDFVRGLFSVLAQPDADTGDFEAFLDSVKLEVAECRNNGGADG